jgi:hypothetical protein
LFPNCLDLFKRDDVERARIELSVEDGVRKGTRIVPNKKTRRELLSMKQTMFKVGILCSSTTRKEEAKRKRSTVIIIADRNVAKM